MKRNLDYMAQLVEYIKRNLKKGYTSESLKWALVGQGHAKLEIERAFNRVEEELARDAPILKTKPKITYEVIEPKGIYSESSRRGSFWKKLFKD